MEFIDNLKKLGDKENKVFLFLVIWLLIAFACMEVFKLLNMAYIGVFIYFPLLAFTLFLWFISLFRKKIRDFSIRKLILLFLIDIILMIILVFAIIVIIMVAVFSYIFLTSYFIVTGCYRAGKERDEKLYYKKGAWLLRRIQYWGGFFFSITLLIIFLIATGTAAEETGVTVLLLIAYIAVILVLVVLAIYGMFISLIQKRLNGWLGTYFVFITGYTFYLVLKVFMRLYGGTGGETPLYQVIALLFLDLFILLYSIGAILGKQGEVLTEEIKVFDKDTVLLWLIFSKAAWEFATNFPWGTFGVIQAFGIRDPSELGVLLNLIAACTILAIFFFLIIIYGFYGIHQYGKEKEQLKAKRDEILTARKSGERDDDVIKPERKVTLEEDRADVSEEEDMNF
jgi:hypothetical protein